MTDIPGAWQERALEYQERAAQLEYALDEARAELRHQTEEVERLTKTIVAMRAILGLPND